MAMIVVIKREVKTVNMRVQIYSATNIHLPKSKEKDCKILAKSAALGWYSVSKSLSKLRLLRIPKNVSNAVYQ